jgi:hypothetical protein
MKRRHARAQPQTFELPLRDILFVNAWLGLVLFAIFRAIVD